MSNLLTPDLITSAQPAPHPQELDATYSLTQANVLSDESDRELFESYSHVLISERYGSVIRELVCPDTHDGKSLYGRVKLRNEIPRFADLEKCEQFHQYLALVDTFETLESHGNIATGVQATKSWSGFVIESNTFRVVWITLYVLIHAEDDQWCVCERSIAELVYASEQIGLQ